MHRYQTTRKLLKPLLLTVNKRQERLQTACRMKDQSNNREPKDKNTGGKTRQNDEAGKEEKLEK